MSDEAMSLSYRQGGARSWVVELASPGLPSLTRYYVSAKGARDCLEQWAAVLGRRPKPRDPAERLADLIDEQLAHVPDEERLEIHRRAHQFVMDRAKNSGSVQ